MLRTPTAAPRLRKLARRGTQKSPSDEVYRRKSPGQGPSDRRKQAAEYLNTEVAR
jgi:hypothetical protein